MRRPLYRISYPEFFAHPFVVDASRSQFLTSSGAMAAVAGVHVASTVPQPIEIGPPGSVAATGVAAGSHTGAVVASAAAAAGDHAHGLGRSSKTHIDAPPKAPVTAPPAVPVVSTTTSPAGMGARPAIGIVAAVAAGASALAGWAIGSRGRAVSAPPVPAPAAVAEPGVAKPERTVTPPRAASAASRHGARADGASACPSQFSPASDLRLLLLCAQEASVRLGRFRCVHRSLSLLRSRPRRWTCLALRGLGIRGRSRRVPARQLVHTLESMSQRSPGLGVRPSLLRRPPLVAFFRAQPRCPPCHPCCGGPCRTRRWQAMARIVRHPCAPRWTAAPRATALLPAAAGSLHLPRALQARACALPAAGRRVLLRAT